YLAALFLEQHGQQDPAPHPPGDPGPEPGASGGGRDRRRLAVVVQELAPHLHVAILDRRQPPVKLCLGGVPLRVGQLPVEKGRIRLVLQVVAPDSNVLGVNSCRHVLSISGLWSLVTYVSLVVGHWSLVLNAEPPIPRTKDQRPTTNDPLPKTND